MLKRKVMDEIIAWKNNTITKRKALVIKGLRQIGKTYIVKEFAKRYYKNTIYINFKNNDDIKAIFEPNLDVDRIMFDLSAKMPQIKIEPNNTLLIFDEIQECANARAALKPFVEDGRYHVIATGSLLGIRGYNKKKGKGVPVGAEHFIYMKPLDFEEFLWSKCINENVIEYLKECYKNKTKISPAVHESMLRYFKEYICVGGLPEAVNTFIKTNDMNKVYNEQRTILEEYKDDFGKHLDEEEKEETDYKLLARITEVFESIPSQLAKENKKFQYSLIKSKGRSSEYREAIQWLKDAGIISLCFNLSSLEFPLEGNKIDNVFKIYMQDSGLFISMLEKGTAGDILYGNLKGYKGAIFENIVADAFSKMDKNLYYYHKDSGLEIDFITRLNREVTLVEVKAKSGHTKSSDYILNHYDEYNVKSLVKLGEYNIGYTDNKLTIPYYLAFLLKDELIDIKL